MMAKLPTGLILIVLIVGGAIVGAIGATATVVIGVLVVGGIIAAVVAQGYANERRRQARIDHYNATFEGLKARISAIADQAARIGKTAERNPTLATIQAALDGYRDALAQAKALRKELALNRGHHTLCREDVQTLRHPLDEIIETATDAVATLRYTLQSAPPGEAPTAAPAGGSRSALSRDEFNALLKCLHPDRAKSVSDAECNEALRVILSKKP
jgi:hypothetical protein